MIANHAFDVNDAKQFGVDEAIILYHLKFWIYKNLANKTHSHDDYTWTYNSLEAFSILFPYWTAKKIGNLLRSMEKREIIKSGNYNRVGYDRTKWYTIPALFAHKPSNDAIVQNGTMENPDRDNGKSQTGRPIPDNKQITTSEDQNTLSEMDSDAAEVLEHLNEVSNQKMKATTKSHMGHIKARLRDGHTVEDCKRVIEFKHRDWLGTEFYQYMVPKTIFSPAKFDGYLKGAKLEAEMMNHQQ